MQMIKSVAGSIVALAMFAGPAFAQQEGLVNVNVEGNEVAIPIGIAAQVCPNVNIQALQEAARNNQTADCEIGEQEIESNQALAQFLGRGAGGGQGEGQGQENAPGQQNR